MRDRDSGHLVLVQVAETIGEFGGDEESRAALFITVFQTEHSSSLPKEHTPMSSQQTKLTRPRIFIGSSVEGLPIAELIKANLQYKADAFLWNDPGVFGTGSVTIDSLIQAAKRFEFAIFVMSPDDKTFMRDAEYPTPRDNLIFEMGLFAGCNGKDHVFMVTPLDEKVELPNDLAGITSAKYAKVSIPDMPEYNVSAATTEIMLAINQVKASRTSPSSRNFWGTLSDSVVIIYGVEYTGTKHPRISLRDLDTATDILRFLTRWYPDKHTLFIRAETPGWENSLRADTDIIIVGGPVTNSEFANRQSDYESHYHLRIGRLCEVKGQGVYHAVLGEGSGQPVPPHSDPQAIDDFPSEYVRRDYGLVTSRHIPIYGYSRRVITISGIKGNGTRGAALALLGDTRQPVKLDDILPSLTANDSVEMVIATDVTNGIIDRSQVIELTLNDKREYISNKQYWEPCELEQPCECRRLRT